MCRFGVPLAPIAEPLRRAVGRRGARRRAARTASTVVAGMFCPQRRRPRHQHADRDGPRGGDAHYDKIHLYDAFGFSRVPTRSRRATEPVVITVDGVGVGLTTCYDVRFPELYVELAPARRAAHHRARVVGHRPGQARPVDAAGPGPRHGHHQRRRRGRIRPTPGDEIAAARTRPVSAAAWWRLGIGEVIVVGGRRPAAAGDRRRPRRRRRRPARPSRCCATARHFASSGRAQSLG